MSGGVGGRIGEILFARADISTGRLGLCLCVIVILRPKRPSDRRLPYLCLCGKMDNGAMSEV